MAREWGEGLNKGLMNFINAYQQQKQITDANDFRNQQMQQGLLQQEAQTKRQGLLDAFDREKFDYAKTKDAQDLALKEKELKQKGMMQKRGLMDMNGNAVYADPMKQLNFMKLQDDLKLRAQEKQVPGYDISGSSMDEDMRKKFKTAIGAQTDLNEMGNELADLVDKYGFEVTGNIHDRMKQLYSDMLLKQKDIKQLGQLSKDDLKLAASVVGPDPTSWFGNAARIIPGTTSAKDVVNFYRQSGPNAAKVLESRAKVFGLKPTQTNPKSPLSKPKSVTQNGQTYILNEQTGEYE